MVKTRLASPEDESSVLALLGQLFARDLASDTRVALSFRRMLDAERGAVIVAYEDAGILGVITVSFNLAARYATAYAQIEELVVDEKGRGKHVGALLVQAAVKEARDRGCDEIGLYAGEATRAFYEKLGFIYSGVELRRPLAQE